MRPLCLSLFLLLSDCLQHQPLKRQLSSILPERRREMKNKESLDRRHHVTTKKPFTPRYDLDEASESPTCNGEEGTTASHPISLDQDESTAFDLTGDNLGSWGDGSGDDPWLDETQEELATTTSPIPLHRGSVGVDSETPPSVKTTQSPKTPGHLITTPEPPKKRRKRTKVMEPFDYRNYSTPINDIDIHAFTPNYDSLTIIELRNAVKKYGFKIRKTREEMITLLKDLWASTNTHSLPPTSPSPPTDLTTDTHSLPTTSLSPSPTDPPPADSDKKQEFTTRVKNDMPLWERVLRYENVDMKTCSDGLTKKDKAAFHDYLDENALLYKPPPKSK